MKRFFGWWMAVCVVLAGFCGCGRQVLSVPGFPVDTGAVEAALERAGLSWTVAKEESWAEGQTVCTLHDPEGRMVAIVSSTGEPQGRMLRLAFLPSENDPAVRAGLGKGIPLWNHPLWRVCRGTGGL